MEVADKVAVALTRDYSDKNPVFVIVLNGAFVFAADLLRQLYFDYEIDFTKASSYCGDSLLRVASPTSCPLRQAWRGAMW